MGLMPKKRSDQLALCEAHVTPFTTNAVAIGSSAAAATDFDTKTSDARAKYVLLQAAEEAQRNANNDFNMALSAATEAFANIVKSVRAKAAVSGDSIWTLASLPIPATPAPVGPPGQPTDIKVSLTATGALDMKFKCPNPPGCNGVTYNVFRYFGGGVPTDDDYEYVGGTGVRQFTDETAPSGVPLIMYKIQAVRSTAVGPWATFQVFLGVNPVGSPFVQSVVNTSPKMAA